MLRKMASDILPIVNPSLQVKTQVFGETLHTLRTLIRKYKEQIGGVDDVCVISGGLQQYLIKKDYNMRRVEESVDTNNDRRTSITFSDLPVSKTYHKSFHLITKFVFNYKSLVCEKLLNDF